MNPVGIWRLLRFTTDVGGQNSEKIAEGVFSIPIYLGNNYNLFINWDGNRFLFKINDEIAEYIPTTDINHPNKPLRELGTIIKDTDGKKATIEVLFDDVFVEKIHCQSFGDFDGDGDVDGLDLAIFAGDFGGKDCKNNYICDSDFNNDTFVDISDLRIFVSEFGRIDFQN